MIVPNNLHRTHTYHRDETLRRTNTKLFCTDSQKRLGRPTPEEGVWPNRQKRKKHNRPELMICGVPEKNTKIYQWEFMSHTRQFYAKTPRKHHTTKSPNFHNYRKNNIPTTIHTRVLRQYQQREPKNLMLGPHNYHRN